MFAVFCDEPEPEPERPPPPPKMLDRKETTAFQDRPIDPPVSRAGTFAPRVASQEK
jgi:hypothetical protein